VTRQSRQHRRSTLRLRGRSDALAAVLLLVLPAASLCPALPRGSIYCFDTVPPRPVSSAWHIAGTINYDAWRTGSISVIAAPWQNSPSNNMSVICSRPGAYSLTVDPEERECWVWAFCDTSANGSNDQWEASGAYPLNPVALDGGAAGIDITLTAPDQDADGLPDWWEQLEFGELSQSSAMDSDGDGLTNEEEYIAGLQACCADSDNDGVDDALDSNPMTDEDTDGDGLSDDWERRWFGGLELNGADDPDGDGVDNAGEFADGTDPGAVNMDGTDNVRLLIYALR